MASSYQQAEQPESFLRSAQMSRVQLLLPAESVRNVVEQLGQLERISFDDVSTASFIAGPSRLIVVVVALEWTQLTPDLNPFQRAWTGNLRLLDEMERRLRFLTGELEDAGMPVGLDRPRMALHEWSRV